MAQTRQNMGSGNVKKLLLQLMIPAVVAQVVNLLYNIVDRIYIGHIAGIGAAALTGVGLFAPILMLLNAFAMLIGAGGAPRTAIALGQGNKEEAEKIIGNSFTMLLFFAVVLTIGFYAGAPILLRLFGASEATLPYALAYSRIYILGSVCVLIVMGMNPFITTQGFAKISMLTTVIGAVINIILDPILIFVLDMGVRGAAIATVLSQAVGAFWILRFLTGSKTILRLRKEHLRPEGRVILPVMGLGISTFVMLSTESLLSISFSSSLARYGGDVAVGAMTVITSVSQLCTLPIQGICQGGQPVMSFNFGAGNQARVKEAFRFQFTLCFGYTTLFWLGMMLVPGLVAGIFTSDAPLSSTPPGLCASTWPVSLPWAFRSPASRALWRWGRPRSASCWPACASSFSSSRSSSSCRTSCRTRCSRSSSRSPSATSRRPVSRCSRSCPGSIKFSIGARRKSERISGKKKSIAVFDSDGFFVCGFYALVFSSSATRSGASA